MLDVINEPIFPAMMMEINVGANSNITDCLVAKPIKYFGIKGLVITGFFAALMSSLSSSFNSAASLISLDVYQMFRKNYSDRELVLVGRLSTMIFIILAIAIVPFTKLFNIQIYLFLQTIQSFIELICSYLFLNIIFLFSMLH